MVDCDLEGAITVNARGLAAALVVFGTMSSGAMQAQQPADPFTAGTKRPYEIIKGNITKAAAKMPEDQYSFKPTPDVRSFGQLVAHVADANYGFCAVVLGEKPPDGGFERPIEKTKTTKADLEKALAASFAYCDKAHAGMTDAGGAAMVKFFLGEMPKLSVLQFNTSHDWEHYGNIVTYMRMKGMTPPSSQGG
jgi:uncharacterized damage-inducible protein DinB